MSALATLNNLVAKVSNPILLTVPPSEYKSSSAAANPDVISVCPEMKSSANMPCSTAPAWIVVAPELDSSTSPDTCTGLKFVPSATRTMPSVLVFINKSSPDIVKSPAIVRLPPELSDIFSAAASEAPVKNESLVALLSAAKSPSDTASIPAAVKIASVPAPSSGALKNIEPNTSFAAISLSPA